MSRAWRCLMARVAISVIRRYFSHGMSGGNSYGQWSWSNDFEKEVFGKDIIRSNMIDEELGLHPGAPGKLENCTFCGRRDNCNRRLNSLKCIEDYQLITT